VDKRLLAAIVLFALLVVAVVVGVAMQRGGPKLDQAGCYLDSRSPHIELHERNATRERLALDALVVNPTTSTYRFATGGMTSDLFEVADSGDLRHVESSTTEGNPTANATDLPPGGTLRLPAVSFPPPGAGAFVVTTHAGALCGLAQVAVA
jgi:hypothetical protein